LKALEQIVSVILHPNKLKPGSRDAAFIGKYKRLAHLEKERIKMQFIKAAFEPGGESRIELYFRQHQSALIELSDTVYQGIKANGANKLYKEVVLCVDHLLSFIENQFSKYFDQDAKIPEAGRWMLASKIKSNLSYLQAAFKKNEVAAELIKIACHPLEDYLQPEIVVTYCEFKFIKELQWELLSLAKKKDLHNCTEQLCSRLLFLNFNSIRFFTYYIAKISEESKSYTNTNALVEYYSMQMKIINQVIVKPGSVYISDLLSLPNQIGTWLAEEINFLEKKQQLEYSFTGTQAQSAAKFKKVHTNLTVDNLSLAAKLLLDTGVIKNINTTELMRMVAKNFRTEKSEHISEESLRNKAYNIERSAVEGTMNVIVGLLNEVRKY